MKAERDNREDITLATFFVCCYEWMLLSFFLQEKGENGGVRGRDDEWVTRRTLTDVYPFF
jgi:hypothetical protein